MDLIAVNCLIDDPGINPSYRTKVFKFEYNGTHFDATLLTTTVLNRPVKDIQIVESTLERDDFYFVILTRGSMIFESILYLIDMDCTEQCK